MAWSLKICVLYLIGLKFLTGVPTSLAQDQPPKVENPVGKFFRNFNKEVREGAEELQKAKSGRDQLDSRPPQNQDFVRRLDQAKGFLKTKKWHDAVTILHFLIESETDTFYFDAERELRSLHREVQNLLNELPEEARRNYRNRYAPHAARELRTALDHQNEEDLRQVAEVYLPTDEGRRATYLAAVQLHDQGQLVAAAREFAHLARTSEDIINRVRWAELAAMNLVDEGATSFLEKLVSEFNLSRERFTNSEPIGNLTAPRVPVDATQLVHQFREMPREIAPQFVPLWSQRTVDRYLIEEQIRHLFHDLTEVNRAIVPTSQFLLHRSLIAFRTLSGLEVRNSETGKLVWETRSRLSLEARLANPPEGEEVDPYYRGRVPEQHPVTSLLLRDSISGSLTTDGRHLFAIENNEILSNTSRGYAWQRRMNHETSADEKWETNEIVAYDFNSGRIRWRLGGKVLEDPFSRPLAGTFFLGPPVSDGNDLYVTGEQAGTISLHALDANTGDVLWSQEIAHASRSVADDQVRRFWPCYPAIQDGVIVCPTACGWLVAVEQSSHKLLWAVRYSPRQSKKQGPRGEISIQALQDLNRRWMTTPPQIIDEKVLVTPVELPNEFGFEQTSTFCYDLMTGRLLWQQDKGDGLYLAGIAGQHAIFVGHSSIVARNLEAAGQLVWKTSLDKIDGQPSGRSLILNQQLLVPVAGNRLAIFDLNSGDQISSSRLVSQDIELGHLSYHQGRLYSHSIFNTAAFPIHPLTLAERDQMNRSIAGELIAIESLCSNSKFNEALDAMQNLRSSAIYQSATLQERSRIEQLEWNSMEQIVLSGGEASQETLFAMQTLAESSEELARYQRLAADQMIIADDWEGALRSLLALLKQSPTDQRFYEGTRTLSVDAWVGGRLQDLYLSGDQARRSNMETAIQLEEGPLRAQLALNRLSRVFQCLPWGAQLEFELAEAAISRNQLSEALVHLQRITAMQDKTSVVTAWLKMAELLTQLNANSDARRCCEQVLRLPPFTLEQGRESHELAKNRIAEFSARHDSKLINTEWGDTWEAVRTGTQSHDPAWKVVTPYGTPFDFLRDSRFLYQTQHLRLRLEKQRSGEYVWSLPLRSLSNMTHNSQVGIYQAGPLSYVVHRGAVHALQVADRRIAWTFTPNLTASAARKLRSPANRETSLFKNLTAFRNLSQLASYSAPTGLLLAANENCVLIIDDALRALDPLSGEFLWSDSSAMNRTTAFALSQQFLICQQDQVQLVRALDGKPTGTPLPEQFSTECLQIMNDECLTLSQNEAAEAPWTLSRGTIQQPDANWSLDIAAESWCVKFDEETFACVKPDGELSLLDPQRGTRNSIGFIPGGLMKIQKRLYAYSDAEFIFVAVAHGDARTSYVSLPSLKAAGTILCFSRSGGLLWSQSTEDLTAATESQDEKGVVETNQEKDSKPQKIPWSMNMIVDELAHSPLLLFISDRPEHRDKIYFRRLSMVGLDKRTGQQVFRWNRISNSGGFSYLHVDVADRSIDLRTYNERLKIQPIQRKVVESEPVREE